MEIPSFEEDTEQDYKDRICFYYNTLPYLLTKKDEKVILLEELIQQYKGDFQSFINLITTQYTFENLSFKMVLKLWIFYDKEGDEQIHLSFKKLEEILKTINVSKFFDSKTFNSKTFNLQEFYENKDKFESELKTLKELFRKKIEKTNSLYEILKKTKKTQFSEFITQHCNIYYSTNSGKHSLEYIFNLIKCNENIPFCTLHSICKIYENLDENLIEIVSTWKDTFSDKILLKIKTETSFINCYIYVEETMKFYFEFDITNKCNVKEFVNDIFKDVFTEFVIEQEKENNIHGFCFFENIKFNRILLSDLIMNNDILSKFICVDESQFSSTKKTYLLIKSNKDKDISFHLFKDKQNKIKDTTYVEVRFSKLKSMKDVNLYINLFSKFLEIYTTEKKSIYEDYQSFLGTTIFDLEEKYEEQHYTEGLDTSIFGNNFNRMCKDEQNPSVLKDIDMKDKIELKDYIRFPKEDGKCYYCKNPEFAHIGLVENTLVKNKYEYLPCCYKKAGHNLNFYYNGEEKEVKKQQLLITTLHRFLDDKHFGTIPENIQILLTSIYKDKNYTFHRMGVKGKKHSFLECVKEATKKDIEINRFEIASQENPDLSIDEMEKLFNDQKSYLDPRRWIRLLEHFYTCNINIFTRNKKNKNASLMIPIHYGPYLKYKPLYEDTIFILENEDGFEREKRCELICMKESEKDKKAVFIFTNKFNIEPIQFYLESERKPLIKNISAPKGTFTHQILDSYKKTRCLVNDDIFYLCNPIPPLDLPLYKLPYKHLESNIKEMKRNSLLKVIPKKNHDHENDMATFLQNKKIASILGEIFIYEFSNFIIGKTSKTISLLKEFSENVLLENPTYRLLSSSKINKQEFIKNGYMKGKQIIVKDVETLKRLICLLRLRIVNNLKEVLTYHEQTELLHFYEEISDYSKTKNVLLYTKDLYKYENVSKIVYRKLKHFSAYYICFDEKLFLSRKIKEINFEKNRYIIIYDENLQISEEIGEPKYKNEDTIVRIIKYKEEKIVFYQRLFLL